MRPSRSLGIFLLAVGAACSSATLPAATETNPTAENPTETKDSGTSSATDAGPTTPPKDAGADTAAPADDILGTLSGSCGIVKTLLASPSPSLEENVLAFVPGETYGKASLSADGQRMFDTANAGGSSTESEVMSLEVLRHCEGATLLKTETEIGYAPPDDSGPNTITDILVEIGGSKVGVSVTRAYKPPTQTLSDADVKSLLEKKLEGVVRSSQRVLPGDKWVKQILHVFSVNQAATDAIGRVLPTIDAAIRADTIVLVTQTTGGGFIYCNPDPPLGSECL